MSTLTANIALSPQNPEKSEGVIQSLLQLVDDVKLRGKSVLNNRFSNAETAEIEQTKSILTDLQRNITITTPVQDGTAVHSQVNQLTDFENVLSDLEQSQLTDEMLMTFSPIKFLFTLQDNPQLLNFGVDKTGGPLSASEAYSALSPLMNIKSSSMGFKEDGTSRASNRTCLEGMKSETVIGAGRLTSLRKVCGGADTNTTDDNSVVASKPVITGGSEVGHSDVDNLTDLDLTHYGGEKIDFRSTDDFGKRLVSTFDLTYKGAAKTINLRGQDLTLYYHGPVPHIDVSFGPFNDSPNKQDIATYIGAEDSSYNLS